MSFSSDKRYGRRGGRFTSGDRVDVALAAIDKARTKGLADGTWPTGTREQECEFCGRSPEAHAPGDMEIERAGRARMDAARAAAGVA